ncbi:hypothetical protein BBK82_03290 [Lentzea guizhouensis]|uniref:Uncharacterized protein n=1 Tax=Lentzea guizhouensis TaxID=1586287 RepID=A0A1B2HC11_9PSEU|nr:hypothetical protein [Lentzea guizhouensis]ANZ35242.1 hypothetical protein BBK82_03290 [Lentzea guizhouensis]
MTASERALADGLLHLVRAEPRLLEEAPADDQGAATTRRVQDEVHGCLRCGERAQVACIAHTKLGPRWVDLCHADLHWLRTNASSEDPS